MYKRQFQDLIVLSRSLDFGNDTGWFNFTRDRVLDFRQNRFVTGINIVDDMLFWTDNQTEPKKIIYTIMAWKKSKTNSFRFFT